MRIASERFGALPIVNHFLHRLHLPDLLARVLPSTEAALPYGKVLGVLLRTSVWRMSTVLLDPHSAP